MRVAVAILAAFLILAVFLHYRSEQHVTGSVLHESANEHRVRARAGPDYAYPNPALTPGAIDPNVTQSSIESTICVPGYTKTVRPPEKFTHDLKRQLIAAYGLKDSLSDYELDHFIPLELGGCPDCVSNLWPEPYDGDFGARRKDILENRLHREVCSGQLSLAEAQYEIASDWVRAFDQSAP